MKHHNKETAQETTPAQSRNYEDNECALFLQVSQYITII